MTRSRVIIRRRAEVKSADDQQSGVNPVKDEVQAGVNPAEVGPEGGSAPSATIVDRTNQPQEGESFGTEFLDNLAHQMVAPLQSIERHCSNIVKGWVEDDEIPTRLNEVIGHTKILTELSRRMRFLQQLVDGSLLGPEQLTFATITKDWIDSYNNYRPLLQERGIEVEIDCDNMNQLPKVYASKLAVHQIAMNLYDNALKYGAPTTKIRIFASQDGEFVVNSFQHVADVVLTPQAAKRIFERGFRADEAKAARAAGTGLGMFISNALMHSMKGEMIAFPTNAKNITIFELKWRIV